MANSYDRGDETWLLEPRNWLASYLGSLLVGYLVRVVTEKVHALECFYFSSLSFNRQIQRVN